jgi:hypothetical protein
MNKFLLTSLCAAFCLLVINPTKSQTVTINGTPGSTSGNIVLGTLAHHASENLYFDSEFAAFPFTSIPISRIGFILGAVGAPTSFGNVKIYLKNVDASVVTLANATYSIDGYTEVFSGIVNLPVNGLRYVNLTTPFTRIAGNNLMMLIERKDNISHSGFVYISAFDNPSTPSNTSRRYNGSSPISTATPLTASVFRAAAQFVAPLAAVDARPEGISSPSVVSCYNAPVSISVLLRNAGTTSIAAGAASVSLRFGNPNAGSYVRTNTGIILPGETESLVFNNVNVSNPGLSLDSAIVTLAGDGAASNDTSFSSFITGSNLAVNSVTSITEGAEADLPLFSYSQVVSGTRNLWRVHEGPTAYANQDLSGPLAAQGGENFYLFDSWSGTSSAGFTGRLYSNCVTLAGSPGTCASNLSFYMSHDNSYGTDLDSMYVSVSTNKGATWTRLLPGFGRYDASFSAPGWRQETVNISAYNGQTIQLAFEGVSKYGNVIGIDDITLGSGCTLPVTTIDFVGFRSNGVHLLKWSTSTEKNNAGFALQRSKDGVEFSTIATIASKVPGGNSNSLLQYGYTDAKPINGINYYRLKQTDFDGKERFSKTISINGGNITNFSLTRIAPNPVQNKVYAYVEAPKAGSINFRITDVTGRVIMQQAIRVNAGENMIPLNVSNLQSGTYFINATCADGCDGGVKRFIKE